MTTRNEVKAYIEWAESGLRSKVKNSDEVVLSRFDVLDVLGLLQQARESLEELYQADEICDSCQNRAPAPEHFSTKGDANEHRRS